MKVNYLFISFFAGFLCVNLVKSEAAAGSTCDIADVSKDEWMKKKNVPIKDTQAGQIIIDWKTKDISEVVNFEVNTDKFKDYTNYTLNNGQFQIELKPGFEEKNFVYKQAIKVTFMCSDKQKQALDIILDIENTLNHNPELDKENYEFSIPMPFPANMKIGLLSDDYAIIGTDFDIDSSDKPNFEFLVEPDEFFEIEAKKINGEKKFQGILKTKKQIDFKRNYTASITVKAKIDDQEKPSKKSKMIIKVDEQNSVIPAPEFKEPLYKGRYSKDDKFTLDKNIEINDIGDYNVTYDWITNLNAGVDMAEYFNLEGGLKISLIKPLQDDIIEKNNYLLLYCKATLHKNHGTKVTEKQENQGITVILIVIEKEEIQCTTTTATTTTCPPCTTTVIPETTCPPCTTASIPETTCPPCTTTAIPETTCPPWTTTAISETTCPPCTTTAIPETTSPSSTTTLTPGTTICEPCDCTTQSSTSSSSTVSSTTIFTTACPVCTECPEITTTQSSTATECPTVSTECPSATPEYPETTTVTTQSSTTSECPTVPTECPSTTTECPECPSTTTTQPTTCPACPTECPTAPTECPTTTVGPGTIKYPKDSYTFDKTDTFTGELAIIVAEVEPNEEIKYSINTTEIKDEINYDKNGKLSILAHIQTGWYDFELLAEGRDSQKKTKTAVHLRISTGTPVGNTCKFPKLIIKELDEETPHYNLAQIDQSQACKGFQLCILDQSPGDWFSINSSGSLQIEGINREDPIFKNYYKPQVQAIIQPTLEKQSCGTSTRSKRSLAQNVPKSEANDGYWILTKDNFNSDAVFAVNVILKDINDNAPEFPKREIVVGYPSSKLPFTVAPPYLVQVQATDIDEGQNAFISYSIESDKYFSIDENTGVIIPKVKQFENEIITVIAKDHGKPSLQGTMTVKVKVLSEAHISTVTIEHLSYTDVEQFFKKLNENSTNGTTYGYLSVSYVPPEVEKTRGTNTDAMRIILYAINKEGNPIPTKDLEKEIKEQIGDDYKIEAVSNWKEVTEKENCKDVSGFYDETGWIVAVSILSALIIIIIVVITILYFKLRPKNELLLTTKPPSPMSTPPATIFEKKPRNTSTSLLQDRESKILRRATGFPRDFDPSQLDEEHEENDIDQQDNEIDEVHENLYQYIEKTGESNDYNNYENDEKEKKKGVAFNEDVEEIHIVTNL